MPKYFIENLDDPRLEPYRHLKRTNHTRWSGRFIAEGRLVVERLIASGWEIDSILLSDRRYRSMADTLPPNTEMYVLPQRLAEVLVGYSFHTGVLARGVRKPPPSLSEIIEQAPDRVTFVVCPWITDPENLGMIIRLCSGFGIDGLVLGPACTNPYSRRVLRVSMGNAFHLPILESRNLADDLQQLRQRWEVQLAATVLDPAAEPLINAPRPDRLALLLGNEGDGLAPQWLEFCHRQVTIPMDPSTDSFNVATAAAIFLYHFARVV